MTFSSTLLIFKYRQVILFRAENYEIPTLYKELDLSEEILILKGNYPSKKRYSFIF